MTDWCKGFCRTCGTGCAEYCEEIKNLRSQLNTPDDGSLMMIQHLRQQVAEKDAEITRLHEKYDLQRLVKRNEELESQCAAMREAVNTLKKEVFHLPRKGLHDLITQSLASNTGADLLGRLHKLEDVAKFARILSKEIASIHTPLFGESGWERNLREALLALDSAGGGK